MIANTYITDAEHTRIIITLVVFFTTVAVTGFMWERHKKYRDFYRKRNHPSMQQRKGQQ